MLLQRKRPKISVQVRLLHVKWYPFMQGMDLVHHFHRQLEYNRLPLPAPLCRKLSTIDFSGPQLACFDVNKLLRSITMVILK